MACRLEPSEARNGDQRGFCPAVILDASEQHRMRRPSADRFRSRRVFRAIPAGRNANTALPRCWRYERRRNATSGQDAFDDATGAAERESACRRLSWSRIDAFNESLARLPFVNDSGEQTRVDAAPACRAVREAGHIVDIDQGAAFVEKRERALRADVYPKDALHGAAFRSASMTAKGLTISSQEMSVPISAAE
jgi:hypothetical protein